MRRARRVAAAALAALVLAACAPDNGTVVAKNHNPLGACIWRDPKNGMCKAYADTWELKISNGSDSGWIDVSRRTYDRYKVGDGYPKSTEPS